MYSRTTDGEPICHGCAAPVIANCTDCGRPRRVNARVAGAPYCMRCYERNPVSFHDCVRCHRHAHLGLHAYTASRWAEAVAAGNAKYAAIRIDQTSRRTTTEPA